MEYVVFAIACVILVMLIMAKGFWDSAQSKKKFVRSLYENYGELPKKEYKAETYETVSHYFKRHPRDGQIDDITFNDLSMDDVFKKMNYTYTSAGEEYLYYTLRSPEFSKEKLNRKEELIKFFMENPDERVKLQVIISELGYSGKFSIYDYLEHLDLLGERNNKKNWFFNFLYIPLIVLCFFKPSLGLLGIAALSVNNMATYFKEKNEIDPYIISFSYVLRLLRITGNISQLKGAVYNSEREEIAEYSKKLNKFKRGSFWLMSSGRMSGSGNPLDLIMDYLRMTFHLDLIKFNQMLQEVRAHLSEVDNLLSVIGSLETAIAIGAYRHSLEGEYCIPVFDRGIEADKLYHPLITQPVKNDLHCNTGVLLTGSNASGKSTFLKAVAINAILAQTIHTCLAESYVGEFYHVYSSMSLKDDLGSGESYYIVEIKSIKRIIDASKVANRKVLCFVDEVLRGTNTVERIAASTQILRCLADENVTCFAATHDIELAELLKNKYTNYHFEEEIENDDVHFNYEIRNGKATTRNAIKLLSVMGYDDTIIKEAEEMSQRFLTQGQWSV